MPLLLSPYNFFFLTRYFIGWCIGSRFGLFTLFFLQEPVNFVWGWLFSIFFSFLKLKCSWFVLISPNEPCNATEKNIRLSKIKTHHFISSILFPSSSAHRQPLGGVLQKIGPAIVLKSIKKYLRRSKIFH